MLAFTQQCWPDISTPECKQRQNSTIVRKQIVHRCSWIVSAAGAETDPHLEWRAEHADGSYEEEPYGPSLSVQQPTCDLWGLCELA